MASYKKPPIIEPLMTFQEFCEYEKKLLLQGEMERGGMLAHAELTDEPFDLCDTLH